MKTSDFDYDLPRGAYRAGAGGRARRVPHCSSWTAKPARVEDRIFQRHHRLSANPAICSVAERERAFCRRACSARSAAQAGQSEVFLLRQLVGSKAQPYADVPHIPGQPVPGENQQAIWEVLVRSGQALEAR